jgi:deoxycytidine triphosphate deaminase
MYLADRDIRALLPKMDLNCPHPDHQFDEATQVQPASIDLRVSDVFWKPSRRRRIWRRYVPGQDHVVDLRRNELQDLDPLRDWKRYELNEGEVMRIQPGRVVMARIYERFRIPAGYAGKIEGRSSFARLGLVVHCTADFINPGWHGFMPLQLYNAGPYPILVTPFLSICQLMLVPLSNEPERTYGDPELQSKYVNDDGGPSLWWRDARVQALQERFGEINVPEQIQRDIIARVRSWEPNVLERFQRHVRALPLERLENATTVLERFARQEDWRRRLDTAATWAAGVLAGGLIGSLFAKFSVVHVIVVLLFVAAAALGVRGYLRRDTGYLGRKELRALPDPGHRPPASS